MKLVMLRTNGIDPDPRVEKELNSILRIPEIVVSAVAWDRNSNRKVHTDELVLSNGKVPVTRFGIPATWGGGMKVNLIPMLKFECRLLSWLVMHNKEYDCVHACDLLTGLPALLPCMLFRKKMVYDIFDYYAATQHGPQWLLNIFSKLENAVIHHADVTIICSEKRKEQIAKSTPKKLVILHNAPSKQQLQVKDNSIKIKYTEHSDSKTKVVYVGNLVEDRFIMKALSLAKDLPNVEFHIGGVGVLANEIENLSKKYENIFFYGKLNYSDVVSLESQGDILLALYDPAVPNHKYAAPNKFYEALALGKPLIMFHNTGMDDVILKNRIGSVCEPTENGIKCAIEDLVENASEWSNMSQKMKKLFQEEYSWDIMEKRLIGLYRVLLSIS